MGSPTHTSSTHTVHAFPGRLQNGKIRFGSQVRMPSTPPFFWRNYGKEDARVTMRIYMKVNEIEKISPRILLPGRAPEPWLDPPVRTEIFA
jgi:hypothetical protein